MTTSHLLIQQHWKDDLSRRERMMAEKAERLQGESGRSASHLPKLAVGQHVRVQDSVTKRWDRSGVVTRILRPIRQHTIRLDGSGRLVLRNRRFLRPIHLVDSNEQIRPVPATDATPTIPAPVALRRAAGAWEPGPNDCDLKRRRREDGGVRLSLRTRPL